MEKLVAPVKMVIHYTKTNVINIILIFYKKVHNQFPILETEEKFLLRILGII
jgi:hypothetical protein